MVERMKEQEARQRRSKEELIALVAARREREAEQERQLWFEYNEVALVTQDMAEAGLL